MKSLEGALVVSSALRVEYQPARLSSNQERPSASKDQVAETRLRSKNKIDFGLMVRSKIE